MGLKCVPWVIMTTERPRPSVARSGEFSTTRLDGGSTRGLFAGVSIDRGCGISLASQGEQRKIGADRSNPILLNHPSQDGLLRPLPDRRGAFETGIAFGDVLRLEVQIVRAGFDCQQQTLGPSRLDQRPRL